MISCLAETIDWAMLVGEGTEVDSTGGGEGDATGGGVVGGKLGAGVGIGAGTGHRLNRRRKKLHCKEDGKLN